MDSCLDPTRHDFRGTDFSPDIAAHIVETDLNDIKLCGVMLANPWKFSIGTAMEYPYARFYGKEVVTVWTAGTIVHPWINVHSTLVVRTLVEAIAAVDQLRRAS
jgi:nucleoside 2-deoxyribosyltransferase